MTTQSAADTQFKNGNKTGPGRPKGATNKVTRELKEMVLQALENKGGVSYLEQRAEDNPTAFMTLLGKVLPLTVQGPNPDGSFTIKAPWLTASIAHRNSA